MVIGASVGIPAEKFILGQVLEEVDQYYAELTQFVPTGDQLIPYFWIENDDLSGVERALQTHARIADVTKYDERAGRGLYQVEWNYPSDDFLSILMDNDVLVTKARGTPDAWEFELLAGNQSTLAAFQTACNERAIPIEIQTIFQSGPTTVDRVGLTEKQREILQVAYERGYFRVPRGVTVTELGEEFGISPQAASKRLRRGLSAVVGQVLMDS